MQRFRFRNLLFGIVGFFSFIVLTQDMQLFPGAVTASFQRARGIESPSPKGIDAIVLPREGEVDLELWRLETEKTTSPYTALFFHGNGAPLSGFEIFPRWFESLGIKSYSLEYRGFGKAWAWPNEAGITTDVEDFLEYVRKQPGVDPERIIVLGYSLGGPFAAQAANLLAAEYLVLISTFASVPEVLNDKPPLSHIAPVLRPFIWNTLEVKKKITELKDTKVILAHGAADTVVPVRHQKLLSESYKESHPAENLRLKTFETANHNDIFIQSHKWIAEALELR